jgi:hypothetical protein
MTHPYFFITAPYTNKRVSHILRMNLKAAIS